MAVSWSIYRLHLFRSRVQQRGVLVGKAPTEDAKRRKWPPRGHRNLYEGFWVI